MRYSRLHGRDDRGGRNADAGADRDAYAERDAGGERHADTGLNGIYVVEIASGAARRLVEYYKGTDDGKDFDLSIPPAAPRWSPDGAWLIYHKCKLRSYCQGVEDYSIFKVNVETGVESKVVDGGLFPDWGAH